MSSVTFKAGTAKRRNYRKRETTPGEDSPSTSTEAGDESLAQSNEEEGLSYVNMGPPQHCFPQWHLH